MNRWYSAAILLVFPAMLLAQNNASQYTSPGQNQPSYQPAVPPPSMVNAYGGSPGWGGGGGGTVAGSAMTGMANAISAAGSYNLSSSAAAVNMTQAQRNAIQNRQLQSDTYYQIRAANEAYRKSMALPKPTMEQLSRIARDYAPKTITANEVDPVTGKVHWPTWLQADGYSEQRAALDQLLSKQAAYGGLDLADQMQARENIETMLKTLKSQVKDVPSNQYAASKNFLTSLIYATGKSGQ